MRLKHFLMAGCLLTPVAIYAQDKPKTEDRQFEIQKLIDDLGAADWKSREAAQAQLRKMGKEILPILQEALKDAKDLERISRLEELVKEFGGETPKEEGPLPDKEQVPPLEELPLPVPDAPSFEDMMDQLGNLSELSPQLKDRLDSLKDILEKGNSGNLDLESLKKAFEGFVNPSQPQPQPSPEVDQFEQQLGIQTRPIDDFIRSHIRLSPPVGNPKFWDRIEHGLIIEEVSVGSAAARWGLQQHDIVIFASEQKPPEMSLPGPQKDWDAWRGRSISVGTPRQLGFLLTKPGYLEVIRKGQPCAILKIVPALTPAPDKKERGF